MGLSAPEFVKTTLISPLYSPPGPLVVDTARPLKYVELKCFTVLVTYTFKISMATRYQCLLLLCDHLSQRPL